MNEFQLLNGNTQAVVAYACGKCGTVHSPTRYHGTPDVCMGAAQSSAEKCCLPDKCDKCGGESPRHWLRCDSCRNREEAEKEAKKEANAKRVSLANYSEDHVWIGDELVSVDDVEDMAEDGDLGVMWAVTAERGITLSAYDILESACDDLHEDAINDLDVDSLQVALDAWCAEQTICTYWRRDDLIVEIEKKL